MPEIPKWIGWPLVAASGWGFFTFLVNRAAFYPLKYPQGYWQGRQAIGAQDVWLETSDGVKLHCWWAQHPDARLVTLFLHGNAGNLTFRVPHVREILAAGSSVLLVDYRGYGRSQGWPTERGLYRDADAAYEHLIRRGVLPQRLILHGESLGTAVAVELASRRPVGGLILEAPLTSAREVAARILPGLGPLAVWGFDSKSRIAGVRAPVLIIHGDADEVLPLDLGRAVYTAAREPKQLWVVGGAGHNNLLAECGADYGKRLKQFYAGIGSTSAR